MHSRTYFHLLLACLLAVSVTACDQSSQKIDFTSGSNLTVNGPSELVLPSPDSDESSAQAEYMVRAFTLEQDYTWSVEGVASRVGTRRDGEVLVISASQPGSYTVTVETTIDGETYSGTAAAEAVYP